MGGEKDALQGQFTEGDACPPRYVDDFACSDDYGNIIETLNRTLGEYCGEGPMGGVDEEGFCCFRGDNTLYFTASYEYSCNEGLRCTKDINRYEGLCCREACEFEPTPYNDRLRIYQDQGQDGGALLSAQYNGTNTCRIIMMDCCGQVNSYEQEQFGEDYARIDDDTNHWWLKPGDVIGCFSMDYGSDEFPEGSTFACNPYGHCQPGRGGPDTGPVCGNGIVEEGETCDDGNPIDNDGCSVDCGLGGGTTGGDSGGNPPACGDGTTDAGEECDDGCNSDCENECGDGECSDVEDCDSCGLDCNKVCSGNGKMKTQLLMR